MKTRISGAVPEYDRMNQDPMKATVPKDMKDGAHSDFVSQGKADLRVAKAAFAASCSMSTEVGEKVCRRTSWASLKQNGPDMLTAHFRRVDPRFVRNEAVDGSIYLSRAIW